MHEPTNDRPGPRPEDDPDRGPAAWTEPAAHTAAVAALRAGDAELALRWMATIMPRWAERLRRDRDMLTRALAEEQATEDVR